MNSTLADERLRQEREDEEAARKAFETAEGEKIRRLDDEEVKQSLQEEPSLPAPTFQKTKKRKSNFAIPGVKKKIALV